MGKNFLEPSLWKFSFYARIVRAFGKLLKDFLSLTSSSSRDVRSMHDALEACPKRGKDAAIKGKQKLAEVRRRVLSSLSTAVNSQELQ